MGLKCDLGIGLFYISVRVDLGRKKVRLEIFVSLRSVLVLKRVLLNIGLLMIATRNGNEYCHNHHF